MAQPPTRWNLSSSLYLCLPHMARDTKPAGLAQDLEVCRGGGTRDQGFSSERSKEDGAGGAAGPPQWASPEPASGALSGRSL